MRFGSSVVQALRNGLRGQTLVLGDGRKRQRKRGPSQPPLERPRGLPQVYRGRARHSVRDLFDADHDEIPQGGRFRWLISTCLAGTVGAVAIFAVIYGSTDDDGEASASLIPALKGLQTGSLMPSQMPQPQRVDGLNWSAPKTDLMEVTSGTISTRYVIYDSVKERRGLREYIQSKPYLRIVARLSSNTGAFAEVIPPFNPFKLYANTKPITSSSDGAATAVRDNVRIQVVELLGGFLPTEDNQEIDTREATRIVEQARREALLPGALRNGIAEEAPNNAPAAVPFVFGQAEDAPEPVPPNTTVFAKSIMEAEVDNDDLIGAQKRIVAVANGDTLTSILQRLGADAWQAEAMTEPAATAVGEAGLSEGQMLHITLVPSLTVADKMEPARFSLFDFGQVHRVTVVRNEAGEFVAQDTPFESRELAKVALSDADAPANTSLYQSIYHAALLQNVPTETIMKILRTHAYETDFRKRIRAGDTVEFFFDVKQAIGPDTPPGDLLFTKIVAGGEVSKFYRFRTSDGVVDYYDPDGNNSKQFLMRKPVRSSGVRLTSGFGMRSHPLLNRRRMHNGVDWAAPRGTPILAAGNGTLEHAGRKGQYGNYIRIRHANGYHTTYGHMSKIARGMRVGTKVRQGQVIGFIGSTGLSSGPHLHFEVLVNKRHVNPMSIQVPRERQLKGNELAAFQKERARIDQLMRRTPVTTASK